MEPLSIDFEILSEIIFEYELQLFKENNFHHIFKYTLILYTQK